MARQNSRQIIYVKKGFLYSTKIVLEKRVSELLSLKYFLELKDHFEGLKLVLEKAT